MYNLLIAQPPSVEKKNFRKYIVILISSIVGILAHLGFAVLFWLFDLSTLASVNLLGAVLWVWVAVINYRGNHSQAVYLICAEVLLIISWTCSLIGLNYGFQMYLWPVACLAAINPGLRKLYAALIGFSFIVLFVVLKCVFSEVSGYSQLAAYENAIYLFNTIIAGIPLVIGIASIREINETQERELTEMATVDELTGLYNRRYSNRYLEKYYPDTGSRSAHCCVVLGDIDYFKMINDTYGHDVGDKVLRTVSERLKQSFRETDIVCRWGGEEFLIVLDEADTQKAYRIVDRIRQEVSANIEVDEIHLLKVTMSFGIAATIDCTSREQLIKLADENLYQAKSSGRNCVMVYSTVEEIDSLACLG